ncbi:hypothetical protein F5887DRAFT_1075526 [Amanita rubescens]|nr:hypothetical protein F5887DRAFT_1075526 [Amanita rubescens]
MSDGFGERVSPIAAIRAILHDYPFSASILRELLQNSDDAKATKQIFVLDMGENGEDSALMAYNNSQFCEEDWNAIQVIHESSKRADTSKIGKYGVGFRACYHVTDKPQILSGSSFAILDPIRSGGKRMVYKNFIETDHRKHFDVFLDIPTEPSSSPGMVWLPSRLPLFSKSSFPGTVIRLPLRSSPSELSERVVLVKELDQMIQDYIDEELNISLLFLNSLRTIEIWKVYGGNKTRIAAWTKSQRKAERQSNESPFFIRNLVLSNGNTEFSWRIIQAKNIESDARSRLSAQVGGEAVDHIFKKHKLSPDVRIAYPLFSDGYTSGRLFTFLPLPSKTDFPVHIHALFALTSSRQSLRNRSETGSVAGSDTDVLIKWNSLLFDYYIPQAWTYLLKILAEDAICQDIFSSWPPYRLSITSGDGLYWQNILQATFHLVVNSRSVIWPKVSDKGTTTYVALNASLVVARGQINLDILIALAWVGLTMVQLPQSHMQLLDDSITKLTPRVARDQIIHRGLASVGFDGLSQNQRSVLCEYFLSDKDFCSIYGLPLLPTVDGSYISVDDRKTTTQRHIALTPDEVDVFRASAGDAISLDQLRPEIAALVREKGMIQANIDLLSPSSVVAYLSKEPEPCSDQQLLQFWSWLSEWRHRDQVMELLKPNAMLRLVPTSKGPRHLLSTVFRAPPSGGFSLLEKLGLAFASPLLPSMVIQFLNNHGVIKDVNDMNDLLAAIDLTGLQPLTDDEAKSVFDHISTSYRSLFPGNIARLKKLPIFPVLVPSADVQSGLVSNTSVTWQSIDGLTIKGISPMSLIPLTDSTKFLDRMSCFSDSSCSLLKALHLPILKDEDVLLLAFRQFSSQPKPVRALFVSYIRQNHKKWTSSVTSELQKTQFIPSSDGTLRSPIEVLDPTSVLKSLFPTASGGWFIPTVEDDYDQKILDCLRDMGMMKTTLSFDIVQERISYISTNHASAEALLITRRLLSLMNDSSFICAGLSIDHSLRWLPTRVGLASPKECIDCAHWHADLFDEVLTTLDKNISITSSFRSLLNWDKPLPLDVLTKQLDCVLKRPNSDTQYRKVREIIRELAGRHLGDADAKIIQEAIADRLWVPTKSGTLARPSRAVFAGAVDSSCFYEISFSKADKPIYHFLTRMGCLDQPTASAIINELGALRGKAGTDRIVVQQAVQLLEMLPKSITDDERASLLVPITTGEFMPLNTVFYYRGGVSMADEKIIIGHHLISEKLAGKIGMKHLGLGEVENDIDLGGNPITIIRNTLQQYDPEQFLTEFIANASDAGATRFSILIDNHESPTGCLLSEELAEFQSASLVVHNDGIFSQNDFIGILDTGIGGKRRKTNVIGHFGLGALSMFHFTELAMIVSGDHVLFLSPSKHNLSFCGKHSLLLPLQTVKRLYADHLEPLNGLFGFDLSSTESYQGTLFRLPLRNEGYPLLDPVSTTPWSIAKVQEMLLAEFNKVAYKSLLFTGLGCIELHKRQNGNIEPLCAINSSRVPDNFTSDDSIKSETVTFESTNLQLPKWLIVTMDVILPDNIKALLTKKYEMYHLLPMRIAAALDSNRVQKLEHNLFCALPLPIITPLPAHISAPFILEQERRNIRIHSDGIECDYNRWLLSSEIPRLYLYLLERLIQTQGINLSWWPAQHSLDTNSPSQLFMNAFWTSKILRETPRRIFASKYHPTSFLSPHDAILFSAKADEYSRCSHILLKLLSVAKPLNVTELPIHLFKSAVKAQLHSLDGELVKTFLESAPPPIHWLSMDEISTLTWYLLHKKVSLDGLSLIPLADGSCAKISLQNADTTYYAVGRHQTAVYNLFSANRLVHRDFDVPNGLIKLGVNVLRLDERGIVELLEERIQPAQEFLGNETHRTWIASFWDARLDVSPKFISHLPLIPTLLLFHFISLTEVEGRFIAIVDSEKSAEGFDYSILQKIGITIVLRKYASLVIYRKGELPIYQKFLEYMRQNQSKGLNAIRNLNYSDREKLGRWARLQLSSTPPNLVDIACRLPIWRVQQRGKPVRLGALDGAIALPSSIPSDILLPFVEHPVVDWETSMTSVNKKECTVERVTKYLRIHPGTNLSSAIEQMAYKRFLKHFLDFERVEGYSLLVPNEAWILTPVERLFERNKVFLAAFSPEYLLQKGFQDIVHQLEKYGLNLQSRLDLDMFIKCAKAFDQDYRDEDKSKLSRCRVLYQYFNGLSLQYQRDARRCSELDQLRFIPRDPASRIGYDGIDLKSYMQRRVLSPSEITISKYEAICWSQRGRVDPQPNPTLCGTYESLGKPTEREVAKHLKVLAEIGQMHGHRSALLSDLKATYKWLDDRSYDISTVITEEKIFLNVDNPDSDEWVWHSASQLRDFGAAEAFLRNYDHLLKATGVGTKKATATRLQENIHFISLFAFIFAFGSFYFGTTSF